MLQDECLTAFYLSPMQNILPFIQLVLKLVARARVCEVFCLRIRTQQQWIVREAATRRQAALKLAASLKREVSSVAQAHLADHNPGSGQILVSLQ